jgi:hypothetical protein
MDKAGKAKRKSSSKMIGVYDKDDTIKDKAREIAEFWSNRMGDNIQFSVPDVMRILVNNYHEELFNVRPTNIVINQLMEIR